MKVAHLSERAEDHVVFSDGLGVRVRALSEAGEPVQRFTLHPAFTPVQQAVQERVTRLTNLHHVKFGRIRGFEKAPKGGSPVIVTSDVEGRRLSDVLLLAGHGLVTFDAGQALQVTREVLAALTVLHDSRNVTHGSLAPERVVLTPHGRVVVVEHVLSQALDKLQLPRHQLWRDWRIATPPAAGPVRFDPRTDLAQVGLLVLAVVLGRPIEEEEYPHQLRALLPQVQNRLGRSTASPIARDVQSWLERLLPIESRNPFTAVKDAQLAFEALVSSPASALGMSPAKVKSLLTACAALDSVPGVPATAAEAPAQSTTPDARTAPLEVVTPPSPVDVTHAVEEATPPAAVAATADVPDAVTSVEVDIEALLRLAAELDAAADPVPMAAPPVPAPALFELVADVDQAEPTADITDSHPAEAHVWDVRPDSLVELAHERVELHQLFADLLAKVAPEPEDSADDVPPSSLVQDTVRWSFEPETERQRDTPPAAMTSAQSDDAPDESDVASEAVEPVARKVRRPRSGPRRRPAGVVAEVQIVETIEAAAAEGSPCADDLAEAGASHAPGVDVVMIVSEAAEAAAVVDAAFPSNEDAAATCAIDDVAPGEVGDVPTETIEAVAEVTETFEAGSDVVVVLADAADMVADSVEPVSQMPLVEPVSEPPAPDETIEAIEAIEAIEDIVVGVAAPASAEHEGVAQALVDDVIPVEVLDASVEVLQAPVDIIQTVAEDTGANEAHVDVVVVVADAADLVTDVVDQVSEMSLVDPVAEVPAAPDETPVAPEAIAVSAATVTLAEDDVVAHTLADDLVPSETLDAHVDVIEAVADVADVIDARVDTSIVAADADVVADADVAADVEEAVSEMPLVDPVAGVSAALEETHQATEAIAVADVPPVSAQDDVAGVEAIEMVAEVSAASAEMPAPVETVDVSDAPLAPAGDDDVACTVVDDVVPLEVHDGLVEITETVAGLPLVGALAEEPASPGMEVAGIEVVAAPAEISDAVAERPEGAADEAVPVAVALDTPQPKASSARRRRPRRRKGTTGVEPIVPTLPTAVAAAPVAVVPPAAPLVLLPVAASSALGRGPSLMDRDVPAWQPPADLGAVLEEAARRAPVTRPAVDVSEVAAAPPPDLAIAPSPLAEPSVVRPVSAGAERTAAEAGTRRLTLVEITAAAGVETAPAATIVTPVGETVEPASVVEVAPKPRTIVVFTQGVNWRRTVAAAVLLAMLESAAFAAAWWWVQPGAKGTLVVQTSVPGVEVLVDGKTVGHTPFHDDLRPGRHTLTLRRGGLERNMPVEISLGVVTTQTLSWPDALTGALQVTSAPQGAEVLIDGRVRGRTPVTLDGLSAGRHTLLVRSETGTVSTTASVVGGETVTVDVPIFAGWVQVHAPVDLAVSVNGTRVGSSLDGQMLLAPGTYRIGVSSQALGFSDTLSATVEPGKVRNLTVTLPSVPLAVTGEDGAEVLVDGVSRGTLPDANITIPLGTHEVVLLRPDGSERRRTLTVRVGTPVSLD